MGKVILGVTISLDGFAEDSNGSVGALYPDLDTLRNTEVLRESIHTTGSVVMAWKEFAMAEDPDWFAGNYEYQVPVFVFTDKAPAGDKNVTIIGSASTTGQCIRAGLADELHIDIIPIFLYGGFRPFEDIGNKPIQMEKIKVVELPAGRTHLRFRVVK